MSEAAKTDPANAPAAKVIRLPRGIKRDIAEAILKTQTEIGTLVKDQRNKFANFDYVSIDTFYEEVAPIANRNGLFWTPRLVNSQLVVVPASAGKSDDSRIVQFDVVIDLKFKDGTVYPGYSNFFMYHQYIGPQTTGSALSYASKAFMREEFKIALSNDPDADSLPPQGGRFRRDRHVGGDGSRYVRTAPKVVTTSRSIGINEPPPYDDELPHGQPVRTVAPRRVNGRNEPPPYDDVLPHGQPASTIAPRRSAARNEPPPYDDEVPHGQPASVAQPRETFAVAEGNYETPTERTERLVAEARQADKERNERNERLQAEAKAAREATEQADKRRAERLRDELERAMTVAATDARDIATLQAAWAANKRALHDLKTADPARLTRLQALFSERKAVLLAKAPLPTAAEVQKAVVTPGAPQAS